MVRRNFLAEQRHYIYSVSVIEVSFSCFSSYAAVYQDVNMMMLSMKIEANLWVREPELAMKQAEITQRFALMKISRAITRGGGDGDSSSSLADSGYRADVSRRQRATVTTPMQAAASANRPVMTSPATRLAALLATQPRRITHNRITPAKSSSEAFLLMSDSVSCCV